MTDAIITTAITTVGGIISLFLVLLFRRLGDVKDHVDGKFSAMEDSVTKYQDEIVRLQQGGTTTPYGEQGAAPVTLSAGKPIASSPKGISKQ